MLDQQFALAMAERGSTGLSQMVEDFIRRSQGTASTGNSPEKFLLDPQMKDSLPLVNESTKFKISEGTTQNFLLNRTRYAIGRNN
jgi:Rod binding domain-containing protein